MSFVSWENPLLLFREEKFWLKIMLVTLIRKKIIWQVSDNFIQLKNGHDFLLLCFKDFTYTNYLTDFLINVNIADHLTVEAA
jgi:hypothetical protein